MKCLKCRNISEIGGAAITPYTCEKCGNTFFFMMTKTPRVCEPCSEKFHVCETCGEILYSKEIKESISTAELNTGVPARKLMIYCETGKITKKDFKKVRDYYEGTI